MELYLQCGHGMMGHCEELVARWQGGTVILSPRDNDSSQLAKIAEKIRKIGGGAVLLDPQFYLPHADHQKLCAHDFWPKDYDSMTFIQGPGLTKLISGLLACNLSLGCRDFILPGFHAAKVDETWLSTQRSFLNAGSSQSKLPVRMTIALNSDVLKDDKQVGEILEHAASWKCQRYYLVCEHPPQEYIVEKGVWLSNVLDLCAGLKLLGAHVLLGYTNQQMLIASTAKCDAIASGTWMNVRSFRPDKFQEDDGGVKRKAIWYYCPHSLSEYKAPTLDVAKKFGILNNLAPAPELNGGDLNDAFSGGTPSTVITEPKAFRHFLHALRVQANQAVKATFDETCIWQEQQLLAARQHIAALSKKGITGEQRDFSTAIDPNTQAIEILKQTRGPILRRKWASL